VDGTHRQLQSKCDGRSYWLLLTLTLFKLSIGIIQYFKLWLNLSWYSLFKIYNQQKKPDPLTKSRGSGF
jgi:hypothetical protein